MLFPFTKLDIARAPTCLHPSPDVQVKIDGHHDLPTSPSSFIFYTTHEGPNLQIITTNKKRRSDVNKHGRGEKVDNISNVSHGTMYHFKPFTTFVQTIGKYLVRTSKKTRLHYIAQMVNAV
jgi:hypothetical protein